MATTIVYQISLMSEEVQNKVIWDFKFMRKSVNLFFDF